MLGTFSLDHRKASRTGRVQRRILDLPAFSQFELPTEHLQVFRRCTPWAERIEVL